MIIIRIIKTRYIHAEKVSITFFGVFFVKTKKRAIKILHFYFYYAKIKNID